MTTTRLLSKDTLYFRIPVFIIDVLLNMVALFLSVRFVADMGGKFNAGEETYLTDWGPYVLLALAYTISIYLIGIRLHERRIRISAVLGRAFLQVTTMEIIFLLLMVLVYKIVVRTFFFSQYIAALTLIIIWHWVANLAVRLLRHLGRNSFSVAIVGADEVALQLYEELQYGRGFNGYRIAGFFTSKYREHIPSDATYLGHISEVIPYLELHPVDQLFCSLSPTESQQEIDAIVRYCERHMIRFFYVPNMDGYPKRRMSYYEFGNVTIMSLRDEPLDNLFAKGFKRIIDILLSLLFLTTLFPFIYIGVAIGTWLTSPGPIFFKQKRTGYNGKEFTCLKFRSMRVNTDSDHLQATKNDPRKTKFGDFLRKSSIDELPQFINILRGDMSIIGPRPHMLYHTDVYSELISNYMVRHLAKPGLTGWAQINGCRGETKTNEDMRKRVELDIWYIEHWSPWLDLVIFIKTINQLVFHQDKQAY